MKLYRKIGNGKKARKAQSGMSLIETVIALGVLLIVAAGVMGLAVIAMATTETQGHLASRTAEYAQDKMEQLLALDFCNGPGPGGGTGTDTTVFPAAPAGGTGLAGCDQTTNPPTALTGGSLTTAAPAAGYVDYLDSSGNPGTAANYQYIRVWQVTIPPGSTAMKQISVKVQVRSQIGQQGLLPQSTVTALKSWPF